ncbi:MAG: 50S ribosomal protein L21 [Mycoplasmoidaceae bacterium]|nr:50S ribosomal protein L21 [Mycoplasmoidaceae bacterium]
MFAIFQTGGKQYKVSLKDEIYVEKLEAKAKDSITFDQVLMIDSKIGKPYLAGAKVVCEVLKQGKAPKIVNIKHLPQKHHTHKTGHRQPYTKLVVKEIIG